MWGFASNNCFISDLFYHYVARNACFLILMCQAIVGNESFDTSSMSFFKVDISVESNCWNLIQHLAVNIQSTWNNEWFFIDMSHFHQRVCYCLKCRHTLWCVMKSWCTSCFVWGVPIVFVDRVIVYALHSVDSETLFRAICTGKSVDYFCCTTIGSWMISYLKFWGQNSCNIGRMWHPAISDLYRCDFYY